MRIAMTILTLSLVVTTGCKKKDNNAGGTQTTGSDTGSGSSEMGSATGSDTESATGSAPGSDTESGSAAMAGSGSDGGSAAMAGSGSDDGSAGSASDVTMAHQAGNCPSTVLGATTKVAVKGKTVVLTISSPTKDAAKAIQKRAEALIQGKTEAKTLGSAHDQKGTHGGSTGMCPVYFGDGGTAKAKPAAHGVTITITPKDKPDELKANIEQRIAKADEWVKANVKAGDKQNKGGVGGGAGNDGMNHSGQGDGKGKARHDGDGQGGGAGTGGGGGKGTGGGAGK